MRIRMPIHDMALLDKWCSQLDKTSCNSAARAEASSEYVVQPTYFPSSDWAGKIESIPSSRLVHLVLFRFELGC